MLNASMLCQPQFTGPQAEHVILMRSPDLSIGFRKLTWLIILYYRFCLRKRRIGKRGIAHKHFV
jgi:hypothetical protein